MNYTIEVYKRDVSQYAEECEYKNEADHECDGQCRHLDGDVREIRSHGTGEYAYDGDDAELYGTPVQWATEYLGGHNFPALYRSSSIQDGKAAEGDWLTGHESHPHEEYETEYSIYLRGDWTPEERAQVFLAVGY